MGVTTDFDARARRTAALVDQLLHAVTELESMHPGRRFTLDGHLVGSIGEAAAEAIFDLELVRASTAGHDALTSDGAGGTTPVEIKATMRDRGVAIRATSSHLDGALLVVLRLATRPGQEHEVVYNGPLSTAFAAAGRVGSNGQAPISLSRLRDLDTQVPPDRRVARRRRPA